VTAAKGTPRVYVGGPRNQASDLLPGSVWKGVNGTIKNRTATVDAGPHLGEKGLNRVTVTGHMPGGVVKKTSPEVVSFLADYRLVTAAAPPVVASPAAMVPAAAAARHYMPLAGEPGANSNKTSCGARLNDVFFTAERDFVVGCETCVKAAQQSLAGLVGKTSNVGLPTEVVEPGYIIRDSSDRIVKIDTGSTSATILRSIVAAARLPQPVQSHGVTVGKIRVLRFVPADSLGPAHIIAFVKLVDSWASKSLVATPVYLHETGGAVTHLQIGTSVASRPLTGPSVAATVSHTIAAPPMDQGRAFGPPTLVKPEQVAHLQGIGIIHEPNAPGNPTPGRLNVELLVSQDTAEMIEANKKKIEADKVAPKCLCSDSEAVALGQLPSMRSLGAGLKHCFTASGTPIDPVKYHEWVKSLLTDQATLDSFRKEAASASAGTTSGSTNVNASDNLDFAAEQLIKLLGLGDEELGILKYLVELKSLEMSNPDADLNVKLTLSQYMRLLIRTEGRKVAAKTSIASAFRHALAGVNAPH
jgi:hypothetical protein